MLVLLLFVPPGDETLQIDWIFMEQRDGVRNQGLFGGDLSVDGLFQRRASSNFWKTRVFELLPFFDGLIQCWEGIFGPLVDTRDGFPGRLDHSNPVVCWLGQMERMVHSWDGF
jgi:hypothetical protein